MLIQRIGTGVVLAALLVAATLLPTAAAVAVLGILWVVGAVEWARIAALEGPTSGGFATLLVAAMLAVAWLGFDSSTAMAVIGAGVVAILPAAVSLWRFPAVFPAPVVRSQGMIALLSSWLAVAYVHSVVPGLALAAIVTIWAADVGAYAGGRLFGRHKLAPGISPGKTWEGAIGGLVAALVVAAVAAQMLGLPRSFLLIAVLAAAISIVGDLSVSLLKRHAGLKDSGRLLPGHGGALDRIDGLTTGLPIIAIGLKLAGILD